MVTFPRAAFFFQNVIQLHQQKCLILRFDSLALWKIINEEDAVLIPPPKKRQKIFQRIFALGIFWGEAVWAAMPLLHWLLACLRVIGTDITRFRPWPPIAPDRKLFGSRRKNSRNLSEEAPLTFLIRVQSFRDPLRGEFHMSKSSWMMDLTRSCEMPSCSAIHLAEIRWSSKVIPWIWSMISGVVTVLGRPGRGASQVEKSPRLNWATQFWTVACDGTCYPNISVRMA